MIRIAMVTVDSRDPRALAQWWRQVLGGELADGSNGDFVILDTESGARVAFQRVDEPTPGKNRLHLDLATGAGERAAQVERLVALGASIVARHDHREGFGWVTLADPEGNEFDLAGASDTGA